MTQFAKETLPTSLEEEMRRSYLDYAMSVIVGRALPDARDGLKPVHRRVLFAMHELNNDWNRPYKKSARIVGDVIGKYHPHGDSAVYDTIVRMAQDFSLRHMLVDGQGNFGSVDGDNAAAMRYTEIRLSKIAHEMLDDLDKETVDFGPNYDGSEKEPLVLPAKFPNLLVNGSAGIAVGMATNIPPHNLRELANAINFLIDNFDNIDDVSTEQLMEFVPAPDFPTGGQIIGRNGSGFGSDASGVVVNYGLIEGTVDSIVGVTNGDGDGFGVGGVPDLDLRTIQLGLTQERGGVRHVVSAKDDIDPARTSQHALTVLLGHATAHGNLHLGLAVLHRLQVTERPVETVVRILPNRAGVQDHDVRFVAIGYRYQAVSQQESGEALRVVFVHLTPKGANLKRSRRRHTPNSTRRGSVAPKPRPSSRRALRQFPPPPHTACRRRQWP